MHNSNYAIHLARTQTPDHPPAARLGLCRRRAGFRRPDLLLFEDDREDYGEPRWVTLGVLRGTVLVIVHTEREDDIHVISMREADKDEQLLFFRNL